MVISFNLRFKLVAEYFAQFWVINERDWENQLSSNPSANSEHCSAVRMALLHPRFYGVDVSAGNCPIRGSRQFSFIDRSSQGDCRAIQLWGYSCPSNNPLLEADHIFPFAFGGPTRADNKAYLCVHHNRCKGSDVHAFPWEFAEPSWVQSTLSNIASYRLSKRNSM